jgi:beta-lactamase regulating signal transducer with metallopeptidase domain/HEAT repeat protein
VNVDIQWLTLFLLKATLLLVAGMLAAIALRTAAARHLVWLATILSVLVLPGLLRFAPVRLKILPAGFVPQAETPRLAPVVDQTVVPDAARATLSARRPRLAPVAPIAGSDPRPSPTVFTWPAWRPALLALWAGAALALLGRLVVAGRAARRIVREALPLDDPRWTALLHDLADRLDLPEAPALVQSDQVEMPFACGVWRSTIVLPAHAAQWTDERRQVVLLHELAHLRRRDLLGQQLGRVACAVYWFHPLVWSAARKLRAESERACDDLVLACGARASDYASHLLDILTAARGAGAPATALPMARAREFEGRLLAILDSGRPRRAPGRPQSVALLAGLGAIFLSVAAAAPPAPPRSNAAPSPSRQADAEEGVPAAFAQVTPAPRAARPRATARPQPPDEPDESAAEAEDDTGPAPEPPTGEAERNRRGLLVRVLRSDPDAAVRRSAAWALAESARAGESGILVAALRGDADAGVREMAAWALARDRGEEAAPALAQALRKDASAEVRATAAWGLGQRRHADTAALIGAIADAVPHVREAAIWALGRQQIETAPPELIAALGDERARARVLAAWALTEIRDPASAPALRTAFAKEEDTEARRAIFRALAFLGDRSAEVLDRAAAARDPEIRSRAVLMLGGLGPGIWPWPWPWPQPRPMP